MIIVQPPSNELILRSLGTKFCQRGLATWTKTAVDVVVAWKLGDQPSGWFHLKMLAYKQLIIFGVGKHSVLRGWENNKNARKKLLVVG